MDGDGTHVPQSGPVKPSLQLLALLAATESMLAAQVVHDGAPSGRKCSGHT